MMKNDEKKDTLYLCDPQKNTECPKRNCQIPDGCFLTIKKEFAVTDENGKPIIVCCLTRNTTPADLPATRGERSNKNVD